MKHPLLTLSLFLLCLSAAVGLTACQPVSPATGTGATVTSIPATPTATAVPLKTLTVCLGSEPESLYLYGNLNPSAWSVLEAVYDGPIDTVHYQPQPVILETLPTLENGGVKLSAVEVNAGDLVANTEGDMVALTKGVEVFPENCSSSGCAVKYDGSSPLRITQMSATFKLKQGIAWSDGTPLTADDSVYSYAVASDPATAAGRNLTGKTASYRALDAQTIEWTGKPGYLTQNPSAFFFSPLPQHQLNKLTPQDLLTAPQAARTPLGWGAFQVDEWVAGDHIRLVKNPHYYRASEGLPKIDVLVYRFLGSTEDTGVSPLLNGECDVMDPSLDLQGQISTLLDLQKKGSLKATFGVGPEWEGLYFGIKPASYDDTYNPWVDRQDFFGDVRTRQAIAYCTDRTTLNQQLFAGESVIPASYLPPDHPFLDGTLAALPYDPQKGSALLDEVGWKDNDQDPDTPRTASNVQGVLDGTAFTISYTATESELHARVAESLTQSLASCGIEVQTHLAPVSETYAAAPQGPIFGRNFDLAELAWTVGRFPPCYLFSSSEIPTAKNSWLGTKFGGVNFGGYSSPVYDTACHNMLAAGMDGEAFKAASQSTQQILNADVPVIPLFDHVHLLVTRPGVCGLQLDGSSRSGLKNIEEASLSETCN